MRPRYRLRNRVLSNEPSMGALGGVPFHAISTVEVGHGHAARGCMQSLLYGRGTGARGPIRMIDRIRSSLSKYVHIILGLIGGWSMPL